MSSRYGDETTSDASDSSETAADSSRMVVQLRGGSKPNASLKNDVFAGWEETRYVLGCSYGNGERETLQRSETRRKDSLCAEKLGADDDL